MERMKCFIPQGLDRATSLSGGDHDRLVHALYDAVCVHMDISVFIVANRSITSPGKLLVFVLKTYFHRMKASRDVLI